MFDKDAVFHTCTDDKIRPYPALLCSCCGAGRNAEKARKVSFNAFEKVEQLQAENKKLEKDINDMRTTGEVVFIRHAECDRLYSEDLRECPHCKE
jgi:hypothetical protein